MIFTSRYQEVPLCQPSEEGHRLPKNKATLDQKQCDISTKMAT